HREHLASVEPCVVSAGRLELDAGSLLPAANLDAIVGGRFRIERESGANILAGAVTVVGQPEIEAGEVDRVVAERVDPVNGLLERNIAPRAFAKLVGIVVDEPVSVEGGRQLGFPSNDLSQPELTRGFRRTQTLDTDHSAADIWLHGLY